MAFATDRVTQVLAGLVAVSAFVMWLVVGVQIDNLPLSIQLRVGVAGEPNVWGNPTTAWRLPLMATVLATMTLSTSLWIGHRDAFARRFLLASGVAIQAFAWVAVTNVVLSV